jgi:hypothetical protein
LAIDLERLLLAAKGQLEILIIQQQTNVAFFIQIGQAQLVLDRTYGRSVLHRRQGRRRLAELLMRADKLLEGNPTKGTGFVCRNRVRECVSSIESIDRERVSEGNEFCDTLSTFDSWKGRRGNSSSVLTCRRRKGELDDASVLLVLLDLVGSVHA